jgi:diketogulonate reductase-like aldo/keto reductase
VSADTNWPDQLCVVLSSGAKMPLIGFGTWKIQGQECVESVFTALRQGFRLIDTAQAYGNEKEVSEGIRRSTLPREQVFVTTKLEPQHMKSEENAYRACMNSLEALGMDYVDLFLVHWPSCEWEPGKEQTGCDPECRRAAWRALERLFMENRAKSIGVSNFTVKHLEELMPNVRVPPAVNQCEFHPYMYSQQTPLLDYCRQNGIVMQGYSPLGGDAGCESLMSNPIVKEIANKLGKSPAQVLLRSTMQRGIPILVKSTNEPRIKDNLHVFDFALSDEDLGRLDAIGQEEVKRFARDPTQIC